MRYFFNSWRVKKTSFEKKLQNLVNTAVKTSLVVLITELNHFILILSQEEVTLYPLLALSAGIVSKGWWEEKKTACFFL